jgi:uncharacterized membrane protein YGL010W
MRTLEQQTTRYAYHRDRRNIATHFVGVPMIVFLFSLVLALVPWTIVGWVIQFIGHRYEGMKPAFTDDLIGLAIGPLFLMTEAFFMLGLKSALKQFVEDRVGPTLAARNGATIGPGRRYAANA